MSEFAVVGIDLGKNVFHVVAMHVQGHIVKRRKSSTKWSGKVQVHGDLEIAPEGPQSAAQSKAATHPPLKPCSWSLQATWSG